MNWRPIAEIPGAGQKGCVVAERFRIYPTRFISCARLMPRKFCNIAILVVAARSEFDDFAGTGASCIGVLEYRSIGVLTKTKARI